MFVSLCVSCVCLFVCLFVHKTGPCPGLAGFVGLWGEGSESDNLKDHGLVNGTCSQNLWSLQFFC